MYSRFRSLSLSLSLFLSLSLSLSLSLCLFALFFLSLATALSPSLSFSTFFSRSVSLYLSFWSTCPPPLSVSLLPLSPPHSPCTSKSATRKQPKAIVASLTAGGARIGQGLWVIVSSLPPLTPPPTQKARERLRERESWRKKEMGGRKKEKKGGNWRRFRCNFRWRAQAR